MGSYGVWNHLAIEPANVVAVHGDARGSRSDFWGLTATCCLAAIAEVDLCKEAAQLLADLSKNQSERRHRRLS